MIKKITLHPSRIGCPSIPGTMKGIVSSITGVKDVVVRYQERSLDITFEDTATNTDEIIKKIGQEMGLAMEIGEDNASKDGNVSETCPM